MRLPEALAPYNGLFWPSRSLIIVRVGPLLLVHSASANGKLVFVRVCTGHASGGRMSYLHQIWSCNYSVAVQQYV